MGYEYGPSIKGTVEPYWLSSKFLRAFANPFVLVDGVEHLANWDIPWKGNVEAGDHVVGAGIRYRGSGGPLGVSSATVTIRNDREAALVARSGLLNHTPFTVEEVLAN
ncbi:hypothetical protein [Glutamicibacter halophytocola]|uniref:hypothetical protein n=1 Tax=Glutamicibacter halophytocola TaxID=1933880 RepID=UPI0015C57C62|nr:hypothetical protein [Glutamicibacter halophytocola]NQD39831.1 hypothetical protein [Glutamicibacter halophytocola]